MANEPTAEEEALAQALAPAHRKLRVGTRHPTRPGQPNALAYSIARAFLERRVVHVAVEADG